MTDGEQFIGEAIKPVEGTMDAPAMSTGGPGLPGRFTWRKREYVVAEILEKWKEHGNAREGPGEQYLRKHWFRVRTTDGTEMRIYFERNARSKNQRKTRWWLYTVKTC